MTIEELDNRLRLHGVKPTANRLTIARTMAEAGRPLSMIELENEIETIDKSVIFRTLTLFRENHLVHTIEGGGDGVRYELCLSSHDDEVDSDVHAHFYCESCHTTFCLPQVPIPQLQLPQAYQPHSVNFLIKGLCPACSAKQQIKTGSCHSH